MPGTHLHTTVQKFTVVVRAVTSVPTSIYRGDKDEHEDEEDEDECKKVTLKSLKIWNIKYEPFKKFQAEQLSKPN